LFGEGKEFRFFKDLEGKALTFKTAERPFKRCLAFQAHSAISQAIADGRITKDWCTGKNFKTHSPAASNIEAFYKSIPAQGADRPEEQPDVEQAIYDDDSSVDRSEP
ncbi:hypothetical protein TSOC_004372, partial [Tetrabaena socialis]